MSESESLSAEDLRNKLYHSLREKGLVDSLKTQLRNRLVTELQSSGLGRSLSKSQSIQGEDGLLIQRAANSLIADHLRASNQDYTLSVFLPESGVSEDKIFTPRDLLRLLNISSESLLYKKLDQYNKEIDKRGFLWQFLHEVAKQHGHPKSDCGIQTEKVLVPFVTSLNEEMQKLDEYYASAEMIKGTRWGVEERMLAYQRQLEERSRSEYNLETSRFKETELTRMRVEEREKNRQELERVRKELDRTYKAKVDALVERERNSIERLQTQTELQEKDTYSQRQSILEEIDIVRQRESELRRQMELNQRERNLLEDKMKTREEAAKVKEDAVRRSEVAYDQKLLQEKNMFKTEMESKYLARNKDLEYREIRLKEDERRVGEELADIKQVKDELREKRIKVNTLDADVQRARHDVLALRNQNDLLSTKVREMVDYQVLKDENTSIRQDLENTKTRLAETQRDLQIERQKREELLREMGDRLSKPTPEALLAQTELDKTRSSLRHEQALYQHQQQQYQIRLNEQADRMREQMRKYEEQSLQMKEMNQEVRDLRHQLTHTRSALDNEVYGKPRMSFVPRSRSPSLCDVGTRDYDIRSTGRDFGLETQPMSEAFNSPEPELLLTKDAEQDDTKSGNEDYSYSSDIVEDTKKRLKNLEREAESLEQNYQNFHFRMTSVHASLPPTALTVRAQEYKHTVSGVVNTNHSARPAYTSPRATLTHSSDRPLSSTPTRKPRPMSYRPYSPPMHENLPKMNMSVSPVNSNPDVGRSTAIRNNQPISMADLEARPGSPSVVVVEGSISHLPNTTQDENDGVQRVSPPGQSDPSEGRTAPAGQSTFTPQKVALDSAWKSAEQRNKQELTDKAREEARERERMEAEDRRYDEERREREAERQRREQERWELEQRELERLESGKQESKAEKEKEPEDTGGAGPPIDPVMQKYMDMVAAQKSREKEETEELAKKTLTSWNKGRTLSEDKTPSASEDISVAEKSEAPIEEVDEDFDW